MDIRIDGEKEAFKMRVAGCVIKDDKLLTVNICDNGFYCLPGGHIHLGESSADAIGREISEEVGISCKSKTLISIIENFFSAKNGKRVHEVCYYYVIEPNEDISTEDYSIVENDEGELKNLEFKWVALNEIDGVDFRPAGLKEQLKNKDFSFKHIIYGD